MSKKKNNGSPERDARSFRPESMMMSYGYKPELSEGAIKCPIFQTSTFVFQSAEEGKDFFEVAYGLREKRAGESPGLIYSRINNPDLEILEDRLTLWDNAEDAAVFESGMSAITTTMLEFLNPGDVLLHSSPVYGGTDHFIHHILPRFGIESISFVAGESSKTILNRVKESGKADRVRFIHVETPANPTNTLIDIEACRKIGDQLGNGEKVYLAVDNTYLGPLWQHPLKHGADFSIYSATKYIGGHSDVIAGAVCGSSELIKRVKTFRTFLGNMAGPWTGWLLLRSLETLKVRMEQQCENAKTVANFLNVHPKVERVNYPGLITEKNQVAWEIFNKQCDAPGAMVSFDVVGGEKEAFTFLNSLQIIKLAVSLGSTESLAEHPYTMTHAGCDPEHNQKFGITEKLVRLSVGVENVDDLVWDISQALDQV